jgi:hypothetical protein
MHRNRRKCFVSVGGPYLNPIFCFRIDSTGRSPGPAARNRSFEAFVPVAVKCRLSTLFVLDPLSYLFFLLVDDVA